MSNAVAQRPDYTFKYNAKLGRHGWLRLTPAYSVKLVKELVAHAPKDTIILDPFSGTATTGVVAAELGLNAHLFDINPFLLWLGNVKCTVYEASEIDTLKYETLPRVLSLYREKLAEAEGRYWQPDIYNIERWWCGHTLLLISALRSAIVELCGEPEGTDVNNLVWIAFCRLIIETSSAAFNHVSMSFKGGVTTFEVNQIENLFANILGNILESAQSNLGGAAEVYLCDARSPVSQRGALYDYIVTSPPYPNRMTYIRELRPYMYWTKFLKEAKEAGELDWQAIGGTWGTATSKLKGWVNTVDALPEELANIVDLIAVSGDKNSDLMSQYVYKYFSDMHLHFRNLRSVLNSGATLDYIVGNSSFYGNLVHTEKIMEQSLASLGYSEVHSCIVRKRNSKKELYEFRISARWNA